MSAKLPQRRDLRLRENAGSSESIRAIMAGLRRICEIMGDELPIEDCVVVDSAEYATLRDVERRARDKEMFREQLECLDRIRQGLGGER